MVAQAGPLWTVEEYLLLEPSATTRRHGHL
jgi:hypothetical protein